MAEGRGERGTQGRQVILPHPPLGRNLEGFDKYVQFGMGTAESKGWLPTFHYPYPHSP